VQSDQNTVEISGHVLALDIGGSFVKSGLVSVAGRMTELEPMPVDSKANAQTIVRIFADIIAAGFRAAEGQIDSIGIAIPGPFEYARGISLMTHKFAGIKDIKLAAALREALPEITEIPVRFRHDANAFLAGEMWCGAGQGVKRALGVALGTGIGVACCIGGKFLTNTLGSPAPEVSVWQRPFKDGIVEDYVSTRALVKKFRLVRPGYDPAYGVKGIAETAKAGDQEALRLFAGFGEDLGSVLVTLCETLRPERIIFGGQISKDSVLFVGPLKRALHGAVYVPEVALSQLGNRAALFGAVLEESRAEYSSS
jgi:glucokinase